MTGISRLLLLLFLVGSIGLSLAEERASESGVVHVVLVWLNEPGNAGHRQQIIEGSRKLREIPGVLTLHVGEVIPSDRDVVDASYDVALSLVFASQADLDAYLIHPLHKQTVRDVFAPIMDHYRVFDFRDQ